MIALTRDGTARRRLLAAAPALVASLAGAAGFGCATPADPQFGWERQLTADAIVLLGEVHDNADGHRLRLGVLQRALARGWRPAIAMEQFDIDRQPLIDEARAERPGDAAHLIERAGAAGWDWPLYRPVVQLALDHGLPLLAVNLPRSVAARLVREDVVIVLGAARAAELGMDAALPPEWQSAQQHEIDLGHCGALPATLLPGMVRAQAARDAVMAERLMRHRASGVVLLAGNGHVRRDIGVPRWLRMRHRLADPGSLAVGFVEAGEAGPGHFDAVVGLAPKSDRGDPCEALRRARPAAAASAPTR